MEPVAHISIAILNVLSPMYIDENGIGINVKTLSLAVLTLNVP